MLSKTHWKKSVVVGAMALSVFAASAQPIFAAENFFQRTQRSFSSAMDGIYLKLPGKKPGKLVVKRMNESYKKLKSFESSSTIDMELSGNGQQVGTAQIKLSGPTTVGEFSNPQTYKQDMKVSGNVSFEGTTLNAAAELKMIEGVTYFKVTQLPSLPGANFDQIKNQWVKLDPAAQGASKDDMKLSAEQQQKMQDAFNKMLEGSTVSEAKPEKKDGTDVYVLDMTISKSAVVDYIMTVAEIQKEVMKKAAKTDEQKMALDKQTPAEMKKDLEKGMESVGEIKATVWVERKNYYPKHFELPLDLDVKKLSEQPAGRSSAPSATPELDKVKIKIVTDVSKFNESFTITAPEGAEDAEKFFQRMMGPTMTPSAPSGPAMMPPARRPNVGPTELPGMTPAQKKQLEDYEKQMEELEKMGY